MVNGLAPGAFPLKREVLHADMFHGGLFADDFLRKSIVSLDAWQGLDEAGTAELAQALRHIFG